MIRADQASYSENSVSCDRVNQLESTFTYGDNEELVSNIIKLSPFSGNDEAPEVNSYTYLVEPSDVFSL